MVDEDVPCEDVLAQITLPAEQKKADIGIAMGGVGSDIALDAADIALVDDEVKELPHLIALSRRMMITIKCNMSFSMGLNFVAIVLAIIGILNPVVGALIHNAGSVSSSIRHYCYNGNKINRKMDLQKVVFIF